MVASDARRLIIVTKILALLLAGFALAGLSMTASNERPAEQTKHFEAQLNKVVQPLP